MAPGPAHPNEPEPAHPNETVEVLSAVTLATADMPASVKFYESLGFVRRYGGASGRERGGGAQEAFTSFHAGAGYLNLQLDSSWQAPARVWGRAIFWVRDVDAVHSRAVAAGLHPHAEPADAPWGERYFHITDPSGHEISLARPLRS